MIYKATTQNTKGWPTRASQKTSELWCSKRGSNSWSTIVIVALTGR